MRVLNTPAATMAGVLQRSCKSCGPPTHLGNICCWPCHIACLMAMPHNMFDGMVPLPVRAVRILDCEILDPDHRCTRHQIWTLQHDGPDHLGMWSKGWQQSALIGQMPSSRRTHRLSVLSPHEVQSGVQHRNLDVLPRPPRPAPSPPPRTRKARLHRPA